MEKTVEQQAIQFVQYEPKYAAGIAEMWNKSKEFWGRGSSDMTAEEVLANEANSDNLYLFLAVAGEEVVGYCGLGEYREDTGALYIPLLNVRPDYHGHKLGKHLIMRAIEKTTELGWPRLDLYTWAGNTKAVPLYKKCGFFWEDREETTHLMNFMPGLLQHALFKEYFAQNDWYESSVREIKVEPDGQKIHDFEVFEYCWQSEQNGQLRVQFERKGRGIRLIETEQFLLELGMPSTKLVSGREYQVGIKLVNKGNEPLEWSVQGCTDQHIKQDYRYSQLVIEADYYEGAFTVDHQEAEQNEFQTYPGVRALVTLNGIEVELKLGITTKAPISLEAGTVAELHLPGERCQVYLDIENPFSEAVTYQLKLPNTAQLTWVEQEHQLELERGEKTSIIIEAELKAPGFWGEQLQVTTLFEDGTSMYYEAPVGILIKGANVLCAGERKKDYVMSAGTMTVQLNKDSNMVRAKGHDKQASFIYLRAPQLGKPFSSEWNKKKADQVNFTVERDSVRMHIHYHSTTFKNVELIRHVELQAAGWVKQTYELINHGSQQTQVLILSQPIYQEPEQISLAYQGRVIVEGAVDSSILGDWEAKDITESWTLLQHPEDPIGLAWSKEYELRFNSWLTNLDLELGSIKAGQQCLTPPIVVSLIPFKDWQAYRSALIKSHILDQVTTAALKETVATEGKNLEVAFKDFNPLLKEQGQLEARLHNKFYFSGEASLVDRQGNNVWQKSIAEKEQPKLLQASWAVKQDLAEAERVQVYQAELEYASRIKQQELVALHPSTERVEVIKEEQEGLEVFKVSNGILELSSATGYFPNVYSLKVAGEEWLDHSFPQVGPKSWWNPWAGGLFSKPSELHARVMQGAEHKVEYVQTRDQLNNLWYGLAIQVTLKQHDKYHNLSWKQNYLMQPGVPLLCYTVEIDQQTAKHWKHEAWLTEAYFIKEKEGSLVAHATAGKDQAMYRLGKDSIELPLTETLTLQHPNREWQLQAWSHAERQGAHLYNNNEVTVYGASEKLSGAHDTKLITAPTFFIFTKNKIEHAAFDTLKSIQF